MLVGMKRKDNSCTLLMGMKISPATLEINMEVPQKTNNQTKNKTKNQIRTTTQTNYISPANIPRGFKPGHHRDMCTFETISTLFEMVRL